jgi:hypothetical protein
MDVFTLCLGIIAYILMLELFLFVLGIGGIIGLPIVIYHCVKNYISSIDENATNKALKITMKVITYIIVAAILSYFVLKICF